MFPARSIKQILTANVKYLIASILSFGEAKRAPDPCAQPGLRAELLLCSGKESDGSSWNRCVLVQISLMHFKEPLLPLSSL